jgi:hypothetical protein
MDKFSQTLQLEDKLSTKQLLITKLLGPSPTEATQMQFDQE